MPYTNQEIIDLVKSLAVTGAAKHLFDSPECSTPSIGSVISKVAALAKKHSTLVLKAKHPKSKATLAAFLEGEFCLPVAKHDRQHRT